jgi:hypothetical protein
MLAERPRDIAEQRTQARALVIARARIVDITERPLNGIGTRTGRREPKPYTTGMISSNL